LTTPPSPAYNPDNSPAYNPGDAIHGSPLNSTSPTSLNSQGSQNSPGLIGGVLKKYSINDDTLNKLKGLPIEDLNIVLAKLGDSKAPKASDILNVKEEPKQIKEDASEKKIIKIDIK